MAALFGGQGDQSDQSDLSQLLAQIAQIMRPTEGLPSGAQTPYVNTSTSGGSSRASSALPSASASSAPPSTLSTLSSYLGLAKGASSLANSLFGTGALGSEAAADTNAATSAVSGLNVTNDGTAAAVEAANDAALGDGGSGLAAMLNSGDYTGATNAALASQLGDVTNDGTAAAVEASNDAALNAADGGAAGAAAGSNAGSLAGDASTALGALGSAYSLYNEINNYQSGATGSDALSGAETGAGIGTMILPGIGTAIGGLLGGAGGAIASAFGGGKNDPETLTWNNTVAQAAKNPSVITGENASQLYQNLAGIMDAKDNTPGHSTPLELTFGRMGEGSFMDAMANQVNSALKANPSLDNDTASQLYSSVVQPWMQQNGSYVAPTDIVSSNGTQAGNSVNDLLTGLLGDWMNGSLNSSSQVGISGQTIAGLPNYAGLSDLAAPVQGRMTIPMIRGGAMA
jgi:hypothetical protein